MDLPALVCGRCGAPLSAPEAGAAFVACAYCGATAALGGGPARREAGDAGGPSAVGANATAADAARAASAVAFVGALRDALAAGRGPEDAVREAARAHLGAAGARDELPRVVAAIAADLDRANGTSALGEPMALGRIAQGYLGALGALASAGEAELNLPFLTAGPEGPAHVALRLTPAVVAELAARGARSAGGAPAKKKWWPF